ncbi:hypothetical protein [Actinotalea sp. K2]|uniref:hypothetical protein n=1 Tax=Actinotalea sp. K2 TaxID=2939438 RepID=UPI0020170DD3|nr:hypothetical protein [Actinotalea sp. K2]MCL3862967.1 hypothetical protein [Actinotalea sp. K2]
MRYSTLDILVINVPRTSGPADEPAVGILAPKVAVVEDRPSGSAVRTTAAQASKAIAPIPCTVLSVWRDSWTFCKATAKALSWHHWVPWMGAASGLLSALSATAVFTNLQNDRVSTLAKALVGTVAVLAALVTALQSWTSARIKALTEQRNGFDELHTKITRDLEHHTRQPVDEGYVCIDDAYADGIRDTYKGLVAAMTPISNRFWDAASADVRRESQEQLRRLGLLDPVRSDPTS